MRKNGHSVTNLHPLPKFWFTSEKKKEKKSENAPSQKLIIWDEKKKNVASAHIIDESCEKFARGTLFFSPATFPFICKSSELSYR